MSNITLIGYTVGRDNDGVEATTTIDLGYANRQLQIITSKATRGISCNASVVRVKNGILTFGTDDFRKTLEFDKGKRCTDKTIRAMHEACLARVDEVIAEAKAFYPMTDIGSRIHYSGDMANPRGWFVVSKQHDDGCIDLTEEDGGNGRTITNVRNVGTVYNGTCSPRYVTEAAVNAYNAAREAAHDTTPLSQDA